MRAERNLLLDSAPAYAFQHILRAARIYYIACCWFFGTRADPCSRDGEWPWLADIEGIWEWGQVSREDKWAIILFTGDVFVFNHREPASRGTTDLGDRSRGLAGRSDCPLSKGLEGLI